MDAYGFKTIDEVGEESQSTDKVRDIVSQDQKLSTAVDEIENLKKLLLSFDEDEIDPTSTELIANPPYEPANKTDYHMTDLNLNTTIPVSDTENSLNHNLIDGCSYGGNLCLDKIFDKSELESPQSSESEPLKSSVSNLLFDKSDIPSEGDRCNSPCIEDAKLLENSIHESKSPKNSIESNCDTFFINTSDINVGVNIVETSTVKDYEILNAQQSSQHEDQVSQYAGEFIDQSVLNGGSITEANQDANHIELPVSLCDIKMEVQDPLDLFHDPAENFELDTNSLKEENMFSDSPDMTLGEHMNENLVDLLDPLANIKEEFEPTQPEGRFTEIHFRVRNRTVYTKEQLNAAILMSKSSLAKVFNMDMFQHIRGELPRVILNRFECSSQVDQTFDTDDEMLIEMFLVKFGSDIKLWNKIFKKKRPYNRHKKPKSSVKEKDPESKPQAIEQHETIDSSPNAMKNNKHESTSAPENRPGVTEHYIQKLTAMLDAEFESLEHDFLGFENSCEKLPEGVVPSSKPFFDESDSEGEVDISACLSLAGCSPIKQQAKTTQKLDLFDLVMHNTSQPDVIIPEQEAKEESHTKETSTTDHEPFNLNEDLSSNDECELPEVVNSPEIDTNYRHFPIRASQPASHEMDQNKEASCKPFDLVLHNILYNKDYRSIVRKELNKIRGLKDSAQPKSPKQLSSETDMVLDSTVKAVATEASTTVCADIAKREKTSHRHLHKHHKTKHKNKRKSNEQDETRHKYSQELADEKRHKLSGSNREQPKLKRPKTTDYEHAAHSKTPEAQQKPKYKDVQGPSKKTNNSPSSNSQSGQDSPNIVSELRETPKLKSFRIPKKARSTPSSSSRPSESFLSRRIAESAPKYDRTSPSYHYAPQKARPSEAKPYRDFNIGEKFRQTDDKPYSTPDTIRAQGVPKVADPSPPIDTVSVVSTPQTCTARDEIVTENGDDISVQEGCDPDSDSDSKVSSNPSESKKKTPQPSDDPKLISKDTYNDKKQKLFDYVRRLDKQKTYRLYAKYKSGYVNAKRRFAEETGNVSSSHVKLKRYLELDIRRRLYTDLKLFLMKQKEKRAQQVSKQTVARDVPYSPTSAPFHETSESISAAPSATFEDIVETIGDSLIPKSEPKSTPIPVVQSTTHVDLTNDTADEADEPYSPGSAWPVSAPTTPEPMDVSSGSEVQTVDSDSCPGPSFPSNTRGMLPLSYLLAPPPPPPPSELSPCATPPQSGVDENDMDFMKQFGIEKSDFSEQYASVRPRTATLPKNTSTISEVFADFLNQFDKEERKSQPSISEALNHELAKDCEIIYSKFEKEIELLMEEIPYYDTPPLAQPIIDKNEAIPLAGLQYVLEVRKGDASLDKCSYICTLCSKKMSSDTLLAHVKSVPHRLKFVGVHNAELHAKYGQLELKQWTSGLVKDFTASLLEIEKTEGREAMAVVSDREVPTAITYMKNRVADVAKSLTLDAKNPKTTSEGKSMDSLKDNQKNDDAIKSSAVVDLTNSSNNQQTPSPEKSAKITTPVHKPTKDTKGSDSPITIITEKPASSVPSHNFQKKMNSPLDSRQKTPRTHKTVGPKQDPQDRLGNSRMSARCRSPRTHRPRSPKTFDRSNSPKGMKRSRSPRALRRSRSPRQMRPKSPRPFARSFRSSPIEIRRSRSPMEVRMSRSPMDIGRSRSPKFSSRSAYGLERNGSPGLNRSYSPRNSGRSQSPYSLMRAKSPRPLGRTRSPLSSGRMTGRQRTSSRSPRRMSSNQRHPGSPRSREYQIEKRTLEENHLKQLDEFMTVPESHPRYQREWTMFWERETRQLTMKGQDPSMYDFKTEWTNFWRERLTFLCKEDYQHELKNLKKRFQMTDENESRLVVNLSPAASMERPCSNQRSRPRAERSPSPWEDLQQNPGPPTKKDPPKPVYESELSVAGTLNLLNALEDQLGSLRNSISVLVMDADKAVRSGANPINMFRDKDNGTLLKLCTGKLSSLAASGVLGPMDAAKSMRAIEACSWLQNEIEKVFPEGPFKIAGLDIDKAANETLGMDPMQIASYIAQQLTIIGNCDAGEEELQSILLAVSTNHVQMSTQAASIANEAARIGVFQSSDPMGSVSKPSIMPERQALFPSVVSDSKSNQPKESNAAATKKDNGALNMLQSAYEDEAKSMDELSLEELQDMLSKFTSLTPEQQKELTTFLKKLEATDSKKVTRLRAMMQSRNVKKVQQKRQDLKPTPTPPSQHIAKPTFAPMAQSKVKTLETDTSKHSNAPPNSPQVTTVASESKRHASQSPVSVTATPTSNAPAINPKESDQQLHQATSPDSQATAKREVTPARLPVQAPHESTPQLSASQTVPSSATPPRGESPRFPQNSHKQGPGPTRFSQPRPDQGPTRPYQHAQRTAYTPRPYDNQRPSFRPQRFEGRPGSFRGRPNFPHPQFRMGRGGNGGPRFRGSWGHN